MTLGEVRDPMPMKSVYKQPLTSEGLRNMEEGTLNYFDDEMYSNLNTGTLEQYLDERTRQVGFRNSIWRWKIVLYGMFLGLSFTIISLYLSLKLGFAVGGSGMIFYFTALAFKWTPAEAGIGGSAGAHGMSWGFLWIFPAIYLLMSHPNYQVRDAEGNMGFLISEAMIPSTAVIVVCAVLAGMLGCLYFTMLRRIWIIEDPLPYPGFERGLKMSEVLNHRSKGSMTQAWKMLKTLFIWAIVSMIFVFLRDARIANNKSALDNIFGGDYYSKGMIMLPHSTYTFIGWSLVPVEFALGWFMRFRLAFIVAFGSIFTWLVIVPLAVIFNVPIWIPQGEAYYTLQSFPIITPEWEVNQAPAFVASQRVAYPIAIGVILGAGITAIIKMTRVIKTIVADLFAFVKGSKRTPEYVKGKGWHEWPKSHFFLLWFLVIIGLTMMFSVLSNFPFLESLIIAVLLVTLGLLLTLIAVKILGEVTSTPSSGISFIMLITLLIIFRIMGTDTPTMVIMALLGTTIFCVILQSSAAVFTNFKGSLYLGIKPYHITKAQLLVKPFAAIVVVLGAMILSTGISTVDPETGEPLLDLAAPQAHAFATFILVILGKAPWDWILIGICIGVFLELMTGMGTAFGLGMYLPFTLTINLIFGSVAREWWQKRRLEPKAKRLGWTEKEKSQRLQHTFMIFAGIGMGEGIVGTILAFYYVIPLLAGG